MNALRTIVILLIAVLMVSSSCYPAQRAVPTLTAPPLGERWFSITLNGERTGFTLQKVDPGAGGGYEISSEGSAKMLVLGFSREASSREKYWVNGDLSLKSFSVEEVIDGSPLTLSGQVTPTGIALTVEAGGKREKRLLKAKGAVFPPPALNMYPLMRGVAAGKKCRVQMLDVEAVKIKNVDVTVIGREKLDDGTVAVHLQNDLYTFVSNDIWVDLAGNTVRESVRDDLIVTAAEAETSARQFLVEAAVTKKDLILDFSLVRIDPALARPAGLRRLAVELTGIPENVPLVQGAGQTVSRVGGDRVLFTVERPALEVKNQLPVDAVQMGSYLESTVRIPVNSSEIAAARDAILAEAKTPVDKVGKLAHWVAETVKASVVDSQSALDTLKSREGNCQSHARLYTALARAAGVPTRFVSGLVYVEGKGFLYHSWAESFVGEWVPVDPTFDQVPADVTHLKLVEGDSPEEMLPLAGIVGRVRAKVVEQH
ncbi:MAG TPA: transglutaminase-like domain-containing protein [Geobacteraceae bacterium]